MDRKVPESGDSGPGVRWQDGVRVDMAACSSSNSVPVTGRYVLVTPARNEGAYIEKTIRSVIAQTVRPICWVIVSDGSTDNTDDIVKQYAAQHDWIELVSLPQRKERNFAGKVTAFNAGYAKLAGLEFEVVGNLDADVSFEEDYFAFLVEKLAADVRLGLVGTPYRDSLSTGHDYKFASAESVTGPCQVFRRQCFEDIGGYMSVKGGAVDRIADIAARFKGWKTRLFSEKFYLHHRHTGTAQQSVLKSKFKDGGKAYSVGSSPVWELFRAVYQMSKKPYVIGAWVEATGYFWSWLRCVQRPVSPDMADFCRREQKNRLWTFFGGETLGRLITTNYFTFPFYIPRICRLLSNWPRYLFNYSFRRSNPAQYRMRDGIRMIDGSGTLAGTLAVVFVRREYGDLAKFQTIVDIGAHLGGFAVYAARSCPDARIYCYEPEQRNFALLKRNIDINGLDGRVSVFQSAVASNSGARDLAVGDSLVNSFHIPPPNASLETVDCTTLKDIFVHQGLEAIDLLKINCEGAEYEILESCSHADFNRIANIRLEYHNLDTVNRNGDSLARFLQSRGYRIDRFSRYRGDSGFIWATRASADAAAQTINGKHRNCLTAHMLITMLPDVLFPIL
jgi:FkbM family methyltransferase